MEILTTALGLLLHIDTYLQEIVSQYGAWTYLLLFIIIFCETGLVVTPFLPGDSLLFAAGAFAAAGSLDPLLLALVFSVAAIAGDTVNYAIGRRLGPSVFRKESGLLNREHLLRTEAFYEAHGGKTIIIARFIPIIRTFAPFVAGIGKMQYGYFVFYNIVGGLLWVAVALGAGYLFGNIPFIQEHFELAVITIIVVSLLPMVVEFAKHKIRARKQQ